MAEGSLSLSEDIEVQPRRSLRGKIPATRLLTYEDVATESQDSASEEEVASKRPRGGKRAPVRGRRRGGRRGGRVLRGRQFEEEEEERLVLWHEERQHQADIDRGGVEGYPERDSSHVILDVVGILSRRSQEEPEPEPGSSAQTPDWCICIICPPRDRAEDRVCCGMAPQFSTSRRPEMGLVITDPLTLHIQQTF